MTEANSAALLQQYLAALRSREAELELIADLGNDEQPVYRIIGLGYLLVTVSQETPGLWRLDQRLVAQLQQRASDEGLGSWFSLLIARRDGRGANGYILSDFESTPVKRELECDEGQLVIREKRHLDSLRLILSTDKQADLLLRKRV